MKEARENQRKKKKSGGRKGKERHVVYVSTEKGVVLIHALVSRVNLP